MLYYRPVSCLILLMGMFCVHTAAQADGACQEAAHLLKVIKTYHLAPQPVDDFNAEAIYGRWTRQLDPAGLYFTDSALAHADLDPSRLGAALREKDCAFLGTMVEVYKAQLDRGQIWLDHWAKAGPDYMAEDQLGFGQKQDGPTYAGNDARLGDRWHRWLKYQILSELADQASSAGKTLPNIMENEAAVRETIVARASCRIRQRVEPNQGLTAYVSEKFLEALAQQQDPHTMYFSPSLKNAFEQSLSTEGLSFGFEIDEDEDGTVEIAALSPGGPAWKSNEINIGDKVVGIETESGPGIDLFCTTIWELRRYLSTEAPERITLLLRKSNGQEQQVPLIKEKVDVEENVITSFVLDGSRRVGYIYLPGFYTHWEGHNALGCANDLAKELLKLRLEGIEGLILDLRNNGGGSMQEALGLAGIFIDEGTLVLERQQEEDVRQLKDQNRGTAYDDPVIVMVNGMSASASEIVAAILQDYHRALIVGDTTYGKSTGQIIMPINAFKSDGGYLKTTVSQYYRVGGGSHQQLGVVPDILLPERLEPLMPSEADDLTAIPADTVQKEVRFTALKPLPREALVLKSATRIAASSYFQEILEARAALQQYMAAEQVYDLRPSAFITQNPGARAAVDTSARDEMHETFAVKNTRFSETWVALDEQRSKLNADERKQILGDMYIEEAFRIMLDLIAYQTP